MNPRRLRTLVRREVQATLRDPFTVTILVTVPIAALLLFGFVLATDVDHLTLGLYDGAQSTASRRLVADLSASGTFDVVTYASSAAIGSALVSGAISVGVVIPADFDDDVRRPPGAGPPTVQVLYDGGEAPLAGNAEAFLQGIAGATGTALVGDLSPPRRTTAPGATGPGNVGGISVVTRALFNPTLDGVPFMVAGTYGFVLTFLTTLITAVSIVNEKLSGTFEQLQVTPATSTEVVLGKILPLGAVFALDVVLMMLIAGFLLGVWPSGSVPFFLTVSSFYVLISLALGLIFSATSNTPAEAVQKTVLFSIPLNFLGGFVFPVRNMPFIFREISRLLPATHYISLSRAIYMRAAGPITLLPELALIAAFGVVLMVLAVRTVARRA